MWINFPRVPLMRPQSEGPQRFSSLPGQKGPDELLSCLLHLVIPRPVFDDAGRRGSAEPL